MFGLPKGGNDDMRCPKSLAASSSDDPSDLQRPPPCVARVLKVIQELSFLLLIEKLFEISE
jgi:hypothetical protein